MLLYIMRHGLALSQYEFPGPDSQRPLSETGQEDLRAAVPFLVQFGVKPDVVVASPFKRTEQTASILATGFGPARLVLDENLASGVRPDQMLIALKRHSRVPSLLIVGHMPDVGSLSSRLTGIADFLENGFQAGEIAAFEVNELEQPWGKSKFLWRKRITDWE